MGFTTEVVEAVWQKASIQINNNPNEFRKDTCGAWILRSAYGNRNSQFGWEIDHITPNGNDHISNLQPLHWENNVAKADGVLRCVIVSNGVTNVRR
jgi:hypothetical protein